MTISLLLVDTLSRAYVEGKKVENTPNSDVRARKERLFAFELAQIKDDDKAYLRKWLNTPTEGMNASPIQQFYSKRRRTHLLVTWLEPQFKSKNRSISMINTHRNCRNVMMGERMVLWAGLWRCRQSFILGRGERETLQSELQMVKGNCQGVGAVGDKRTNRANRAN